METVVLKVEGMRCNHCKHSIESVLKAIGVTANADIAAQIVSAEFDPAKTNPENIKNAIEETGFHVRG